MASVPSEVLDPQHAVTVTKGVLLAMSRSLESRCTTCGPGDTIVATLQHARNLTPLTAGVYSNIARRGIDSTLIGTGLEHRRLPGVHLAGLPPGDPLELEWDVFVLTAREAWGFVAVDLGDEDGPDLQRRFRWVRTDDRASIERSVQLLRNVVTDWTARV